MGATRAAAEKIANQIEARLYNGISTKQILQMIYRRMKKHKPVMKHQIDLRRALSLINPAPDFEQYIQILLREHGYQVTPNRIIRGRCVEHEIDAIAKKDNKTYMVEVKHHYKYHTPTNLDVTRISRAILEDVTEAHQLDQTDLKIDYAMIVCNTKLSEHAKRYANCRGISHIGWSTPKNKDLQTMIQEKKLYPTTFLKALNAQARHKLSTNGILTLKQLTERHPAELKRQTGLSIDKVESIVTSARAVLSGN